MSIQKRFQQRKNHQSLCLTQESLVFNDFQRSPSKFKKQQSIIKNLIVKSTSFKNFVCSKKLFPIHKKTQRSLSSRILSSRNQLQKIKLKQLKQKAKKVCNKVEKDLKSIKRIVKSISPDTIKIRTKQKKVLNKIQRFSQNRTTFKNQYHQQNMNYLQKKNVIQKKAKKQKVRKNIKTKYKRLMKELKNKRQENFNFQNYKSIYKKYKKRNSFSTYGQNNMTQKRNQQNSKLKKTGIILQNRKSFIKSCVFSHKTFGLRDARTTYLNYLNQLINFINKNILPKFGILQILNICYVFIIQNEKHYKQQDNRLQKEQNQKIEQRNYIQKNQKKGQQKIIDYQKYGVNYN